jgi:hypothetical protein
MCGVVQCVHACHPTAFMRCWLQADACPSGALQDGHVSIKPFVASVGAMVREIEAGVMSLNRCFAMRMRISLLPVQSSGTL